MLKIYDKAQWHIDAGEAVSTCITRIKTVFEFLNKKDMLTEEGKEILETGIDSSISLNEKMVTESADCFLTEFYNDILQVSLEKIKDTLEEKYSSWVNNNQV